MERLKLRSGVDLRPGTYFRLHIVGEERSYPDLLDVSTFLLDLTTLYEVIRFGVANPEAEFNRFTLYRNRNRVADDEKLLLEALRHESPIDLSALFSAAKEGVVVAAALWTILDKLWNLRLNRRKLAAEVEKVERENAKARDEDDARRVLRSIELREQDRVVPRLEERLRSSPVKVAEVELEAVEVHRPGGDPDTRK